jgi:hypothetical protein
LLMIVLVNLIFWCSCSTPWAMCRESICTCMCVHVCLRLVRSGWQLGADEVSGKVVIEKSLAYTLLLMVPEQVWDWHCCSYCFLVVFVSWSFVLCFAFPSLEFSVAGWRSVNLALLFLNYENWDFSILMRGISTQWLTIKSYTGQDMITCSKTRAVTEWLLFFAFCSNSCIKNGKKIYTIWGLLCRLLWIQMHHLHVVVGAPLLPSKHPSLGTKYVGVGLSLWLGLYRLETQVCTWT